MNKQHNTTGTFSTGTNNFPVNQTLFQSLSKVTQIIAAGLLTLALAVVIQVASTSVASAQIHGDHEHEEPVCLEAESPDNSCGPSYRDLCEGQPGLTPCDPAEPLIDDPQGPEPLIPCPNSSCNDWSNDPGPEPFIPSDLDVWRTVDFSSLDAIKHFGNSVCDESIGHLYGIRCAFYNLPDHLRPFETPDN
ncbi:MAG: hypothetical protein P8O86_08735 [Actinomycetota bacterium]|nr:hypothetical protein [Actinomycetota bacterium]MDG2120295.1 hypothetical protein [Actinomycetota bacterium]